MSVTPLPTHKPTDRPIRVDITWTELLRTPDRQLRRLLADRYRQAAHTETILTGALTEIETGGIIATARRHQVAAMLDAEVQRLEAAAAWQYEQMSTAYTARIQAGERVRPTLYVEEAAA